MLMVEKKAVFAAGCFWGVQYLFNKKQGVISTIVGYTGGKIKEPSYEQVKTGITGHYEAILVHYDEEQLSYEDLVKYFFEIHDFTQEDGQGPDIGPQYRSNIFYLDNEQKDIAQKIIMQLFALGYDVKTGLTKFEKFWQAEDYHQNYYIRTGKKPYCHIHRPINWNNKDNGTLPKFYPQDYGPTII